MKTSYRWFAAASLFLLGSVAAVILGQLRASARGPMLSLVYSLGAIICTVVSLVWRRS